MSLWTLSLRRSFARMGEAGDVARFYRALGFSLAAGLTMPNALALLTAPDAEPVSRERAKHLVASVARGGTLVEGARAGRFLELEIALIELGEESGRLESTLASLAAFFEAEHRLALVIKTKATKWLINPVAGCFIVPAPLLYTHGLSAYLWAMGSALATTLLFAGAVAWWTFNLIRGMPRYAVARLLWALAVAIEAGLPIQRSVQLAAAALGPCSTSTQLLQVPPAQWEAGSLAENLARTCRLPKAALFAVQNMERTGNTTNTLRWMAKAFEEGTLS